jgi:hypothetical protein
MASPAGVEKKKDHTPPPRLLKQKTQGKGTPPSVDGSLSAIEK